MRGEKLFFEQSCLWIDAVCLLLTIFIILFFKFSFAQTYFPDASFSGKPTMSAKQLKLKQLKLKRSIPKLETSLSELFVNRNQLSDMFPQNFRKIKKYLVTDSVRVVIIIENESFLQRIKNAAELIGGKAVAQFETRLEVMIPINELKALSELEGVVCIRRPRPVHLNNLKLSTSQLPPETFVTQGVNASNAHLWHNRNITGDRVKVAIIDSFADYQIAQSIGELPAKITEYGTLDTSDRHGTAVAEIIYDMAPGVEMTFCSPDSVTQMASYIVGLAQAGNYIISSSACFYNDEPGDGSGTVSSAINTAHNTYGTLYCQAAGNDAQSHWDGYFVNAGWPRYDDHAFAPGVVFNRLGILPAGFKLELYLRWNSWPTTDQDYDLWVVYWDGEDWVGETGSDDTQNGSQPPTEEVIYEITKEGEYAFYIQKWSASGNQVLDIHVYELPSPLEIKNSERSLDDPATAAMSFSVAAVDVYTFNLESYSAWGPTHGPGGALICGNNKPRISAYASVDTWSYGYAAFSGTSAAQPHVAGAAALVWQAYPYYTAAQIAQFLENRAMDHGTVGYDYLFGCGCLNLGDPPDVKTSLMMPWIPLLLLDD